jgi:hypothetical protein
VRVLVAHRDVSAPVRVRLSRRIAWRVRMAVVLVMDVSMLVFERLMLMLVSLGEVQIDAHSHQRRRP